LVVATASIPQPLGQADSRQCLALTTQSSKLPTALSQPQRLNYRIARMAVGPTSLSPKRRHQDPLCGE
jgi:hypothetical protein